VARRRDLLALFRSVLHGQAATTVLVRHDLREAARLGARVAIMESGSIGATGSVREIIAQPRTPFLRALADDMRPIT
jgi:ABC-type proline/glycine betaine transport system ATPase subunit